MKFLKTILSTLLAASILAVASVNVFAAGTVTYEGSSKKFIFEPGSSYSPTDLFTDFKGVMPGDSILQKIYIKNNVENNVKIKLYMKSTGAHEGSEDFLSKLHLSVTQDGDSNLFDAPADQTAQLTEWVYLGTFYSGAEIDLNVILRVPMELDNTYQNEVGYLDWQFKVEELPVEEGDPSAPQTGDNSHIGLYITVMCVSLIGFMLLIITKPKKQEHNT